MAHCVWAQAFCAAAFYLLFAELGNGLHSPLRGNRGRNRHTNTGADCTGHGPAGNGCLHHEYRHCHRTGIPGTVGLSLPSIWPVKEGWALFIYYKNRIISLIICILILLTCICLSLALQTTQPTQLWDEKMRAAQIMTDCMARIQAYQAELGILPVEEDIHKTGLLGPRYTPITTTLGAPEAKRTTADSQMAALVVQLLDEAGISSGDTVGAGFSGSFPGMNLAVLSACSAMEVNIIFIPSVGASTFGATWPQLTFPEIAYRLFCDGLLPTSAAAYSMGGTRDCGIGMDPAVVAEIQSRMKQTGIEFLYEESYEKNIAARMKIYETLGPIDCFIGVGGNITTSGVSEIQLDWGVLHGLETQPLTQKSGLLQHYAAQGIPVIHLLNIKQLVADYGLPYDPAEQIPPGEGPLFFSPKYPLWPTVVGILTSFAVLGYSRNKERTRRRIQDVRDNHHFVH